MVQLMCIFEFFCLFVFYLNEQYQPFINGFTGFVAVISDHYIRSQNFTKNKPSSNNEM